MPVSFPLTKDSATPEVVLPLLGAAGSTSTGAWMDWPGGIGEFIVECSAFNGATVKLEALFPGGSNALAVTGAPGTTVLTANGFGNFEIGQCQIRASISVAVPSAPVFASARRLEY